MTVRSTYGRRFSATAAVRRFGARERGVRVEKISYFSSASPRTIRTGSHGAGAPPRYRWNQSRCAS